MAHKLLTIKSDKTPKLPPSEPSGFDKVLMKHGIADETNAISGFRKMFDRSGEGLKEFKRRKAFKKHSMQSKVLEVIRKKRGK